MPPSTCCGTSPGCLNDLKAAKMSSNNDDMVEGEIRNKLQELKETINTWESENQDMFGGLVNKANDPLPLPPTTPLLPQSLKDPSVMLSLTSGPSVAQLL